MQPPIPTPVFVPTPVPPSWLQIGSTAATTAAVVVAIVVVVINLVQRRNDRAEDNRRVEASALAHARLVRLTGRPRWEPIPGYPDGGRGFGIELTNLDDRTILDITMEYWTREGSGGDPAEPFRGGPEVMRPEENRVHWLYIGEPEGGGPPGLTHWRIRWSDVDGYEWCFDQYGQREPIRYTGQPPRPYNN